MRRLDTRLDGPVLLEPDVHGDERGFFCETYRRSTFMELGILEEMVQDNHSRSRPRGRARDALPDRARRGEARALRARRDLRRARRRAPRLARPSAQWEGFELSDENMRILYVPVGFAHGFCVLSRHRRRPLQAGRATTTPATERGIKYDDPGVGIEWPLPATS